MERAELKNFSLIEIPANKTLRGKTEYVLLNGGGHPYKGFSLFCKMLNDSDRAKNTRESYIAHVAHFLDYIAEISIVSPQKGVLTFDGFQLVDVIDAYPEFLSGGTNNTSDIMSEVATNLKRTALKKTSIAPHIAAVNLFLEYSETVQTQLMQLAEFEEDVGLLSNQTLFPVVTKGKLHKAEKIAIDEKSMLAGVISGGSQLKSFVRLKLPKNRQSKKKDLKDFPASKFVELLENGFKSYRDKTYYCLLGASGTRQCEADILTFEDLDFENQQVFTIDPTTRPLSDFNHYLTAQEVRDLPWKSRATPFTLLIEPWGSLFWYYLDLYMTHEYRPTEKHPFIFQILKGENKGSPFFEADKSSVRKLFKDKLKKAGMPRSYDGHSLRHMYGVFLKNYYPNPKVKDAYGLPDTTIQQLMGHASLESTLKYAKPDVDIYRAKHVTSQLMFAPIPELKLRATRAELQQRLMYIEEQIEEYSSSESSDTIKYLNDR